MSLFAFYFARFYNDLKHLNQWNIEYFTDTNIAYNIVTMFLLLQFKKT
jgi:hypothetical protein